ncbi:tRNA (guanosine(37)-N1)-methyltransferase TrmD [Veillonella sp. YH-vei2232]|uniref:tRNA (guanine-N(1)-)-methyltransferase n=1 Tax=Veillonella absiana TaxID=3079305 RepID=A0ABU3Z9Z0_9FIRM|nr:MULTISPECIES: tRNA (guanosine(37)-N1)-methyltransferase TrmD [unclassified Veillonella]MDV5063945.1 tRNA (guanosine(37)-N1)-methyltransferase TrmD [Veillonella sp. YH-vei2232]MDV5088738.1 tRNA (guanosine(37)-N1)-methyltransferase TrmD [Veillonella sp. YH-vei2233]
MNIDIISLFPEFFDAFFTHSIIKRAIEAERLTMKVTNPRDFSHNKHNQVDDTPYGGGAGMLMMAPPIFEAVESVTQEPNINRRVIFLGPAGERFTQEKARQLATYDQIVLVCGHYEGVDYRVEEHLVDETISIGDFVLTGGELPAMVVSDAVARMIPGVLGAATGAVEDSFYRPVLECPQYTKPPEFRGMEVPAILRSGHHANIAKWRLQESLKRTQRLRPDLLDRELTKEERKALKEIAKEAVIL